MADDIDQLCSKISLTDGEKVGISITEGEVEEVRKKGELCLVGRLWSEKKTNKEAFKSVLSGIWRLRGRVFFKEIQDNLWLFEFTKADDKRRVLEGRPWSFDRQMIVINDFDGKITPSQMVFTHSPFWIQVHDMPLLCMSKTVGTKIGNSLGELEDVDMARDGEGWGRCLRLRVTIDLTKPLERGRALKLGDKSNWVMFKYEKLPLFCFHCGRIVHDSKGCTARKNPGRLSDEGEKEWGTWLRVEIPRRPGPGDGGTKDWRYSGEDDRRSDSGWGGEKQGSWGNPSRGTQSHGKEVSEDSVSNPPVTEIRGDLVSNPLVAENHGNFELQKNVEDLSRSESSP
jgi:hypothetical protein